MGNRDRLAECAEQMLEIIHVRCSATTASSAAESLHEFLGSLEGTQVRCFHNSVTPEDLSLHLLGRSQDSIPKSGSPLGLRLAASLREFGQVSHSLWIPVFPPSIEQEDGE